MEYEIHKSFDSLESTNSGTYANRLISLDPLTRSYKETDFNYDKYASKADTANENPVLSAATNSLGIKQTEAYESRLKLAFGNSNQNDVQYIRERQGSVAKDIYIETYVPYRTAQLSLANYTKVKLVIPGDSSLTVGRTIVFNLFSLQNDTLDSKQLDNYFSGKYLVTALRHVIQTNGSYKTIVEIAKESSDTPYVQPDITNVNYRNNIDV